ncbi:effector-associated constant component EACC1 [Streptomyces griseoluteus]|uniref:effector-associated constant component EACC1 n=1 Tax=Streptomyces griseoluteus TaxID=29306 RepID=UPI0036F6D5EB
MDVTLTAAGGQDADELRSLRTWLADVDELRGRVALVESPPVPGTLGPVLDALAVALGPGGVATALATAVFSWIRQRRGEVTVKISRPDGAAVEISAKRVQGVEGSSLRELLADAVRVLEADGPGEVEGPR